MLKFSWTAYALGCDLVVGDGQCSAERRQWTHNSLDTAHNSNHYHQAQY